jgi:hypothetical protein
VSVLGTIANETVARLEERILPLRRVILVGAPSEFEEIALNSPSAGVVVTRVENSFTDTPAGEEYAYITVQVWFTALRFGIDERESGMADADGVYDLFDEIHSAMQAWTPTGCNEPFRMIESDVADLSEGMVVSFATYRTAKVI